MSMGGHSAHECEMWNRIAWVSSGCGVILDNCRKRDTLWNSRATPHFD